MNPKVCPLPKRWQDGGAACPPTGSLDPSEPAQSEDEDDNVLPGYSDLREFLLESAEYAWLVRNLNISLQSDVNDAARTRIRQTILNSLHLCVRDSKGRYKLSIKAPWQPRQFFRQQYGHLSIPPLFRSVITLSGSDQDAYAATCQGYAQWLWPSFGSRIISLIQSAVDSTSNVFHSQEKDLDLRLLFGSEWTFFELSGDLSSLLDAAEVLIWISSSCRASTGEGMQTCHLELRTVSKKASGVELVAKILADEIASSAPSSASCWHAMFRNPMIVQGFPIPPRTIEERGLEISVELMLALAQTLWATVYNGTLILKGFATLLTPTLKVGGSVIWHLTADTGGRRLSYNRGFGKSVLNSLDDALFPGARHFVGWLRSADYLVGKFYFFWESNISWVPVLTTTWISR